MVQLYFLSIVFNGLAGFLFIFGDFEGNSSGENNMKFSSVNHGFRLAFGILAAAVGILKLFVPYHSMPDGGMPVLGDLLPAIAGIAAGFMLIFGFYREHSAGVDDSEGKVSHVGEMFLYHKKAVGIALIVAALLHFLFPYALFL